jgi:hypothetical protein
MNTLDLNSPLDDSACNDDLHKNSDVSIYRTLKAIHEDLAISTMAMSICGSLLIDISSRIEDEIKGFVLTGQMVIAAVQQMFRNCGFDAESELERSGPHKKLKLDISNTSTFS